MSHQIVDPTTSAAYRAELDRIMRQVRKLDRAAQDTAIALVRRLQRQVVDDLAAVGELTAPLYQRTLTQLDNALAAFARQYQIDLTALRADGARLGTALTADTLKAAGLDFALAGIAPEQLAVIAQFDTPLIGGLVAAARTRINAELAAVLLGARSHSDALRNIGSNLRDRNHFRSIAARAQAILVTEVGRAQAVATQAAQNELVRMAPGIRKRWLNAHLPRARPAHLEAEARYHPDGTVGPIPVDHPFSINGHEALYPRDPSLPAAETVHCHCVSVTVVPADTAEQLQPAPTPDEAATATSR